MFTALNVIPLLFFVVWLGLVAYVILLATRLVNAVEQIARAMTQRPSESPRT
jgi:Flp pilus assembly protein TadG